MFVAGTPELAAGARRVRRRLPDGRRRERGEHVHGPRHRRPHGAHAAAADPQRAHARRGGAGVRHPLRDHGDVPARARGQRAHRRARARRLLHLRLHLHALAQAQLAAEHRDRRRGRRLSAAGGLGGGHGPRRPDRDLPVPHHLLLDAAALLGARAEQAAWTTGARACRWRRSCGASARRCATCSGTRSSSCRSRCCRWRSARSGCPTSSPPSRWAGGCCSASCA